MSIPKVYIQLTEGEWIQVEKRVHDLGKSGLHSYLRCEISRLMIVYSECPVCITPASGQLIKRRHHLPDDIYLRLTDLSNKMHKPVSTIIHQFLINPLLTPDMDGINHLLLLDRDSAL